MDVDHPTKDTSTQCFSRGGRRGSVVSTEPPHEAECRAGIDDNPNMLVPWYLMASHAYHWLDRMIISDALYDEICQRLDAEWEANTHRHKSYIDRSALACCSGDYLTEDRMPQWAFWALQELLRFR
jgi:hypothetical protein